MGGKGGAKKRVAWSAEGDERGAAAISGCGGGGSRGGGCGGRGIGVFVGGEGVGGEGASNDRFRKMGLSSAQAGLFLPHTVGRGGRNCRGSRALPFLSRGYCC